ncbi:MAG: hypothetical protein FD180_3896 [Planctomycetota bacterium]|nr:MAG: hypothetical protein FD180_3896 [Planctomycetota bacterium]
MSPLPGLLASARLALRQFLNGPRKWLLLLLGAVFPGIISIFAFAVEQGPVNPFLQIFDGIYFSVILLLIALLGATSGFSGDAEDGTVVYLFTRPTSRWAIVLGKWLGTIPPLILLSLVPVLVSWVLAQHKPGDESKSSETAGSSELRSTGDANKPGTGAPNRTSAPPRPRAIHETPGAKELALISFATALSTLEFGTLFYALGVVIGRPYVVGLCYSVLFELILGLTPFKMWVLSKMLRGAVFRIPTPIPRFWQGALENLPSATVCTIGLLVVPVASLAIAMIVVGQKSYLAKAD